MNSTRPSFRPLMPLVTGLPAVHPCPPIDLPQEQPPAAAITPCAMHHFFTDGSADPPDLKQDTVAGWAVSSRPLPGPLQNILRAETFALLQILREAVPCKVYCENATVCRHYEELLLEPYSLANWHTKADPDLWVHISQLLFAVGPGLVQLENVQASRPSQNMMHGFLRRVMARLIGTPNRSKR